MCLAIDDQFVRFKVRITTMINVASFVAIECRIDNVVIVQTEEVAVSNTKFLIILLTLVSNWHANFFTDVLDHNVFRIKPNYYNNKEDLLLTCKQSISVDLTGAHLNCFRSVFCSTVLHSQVNFIAFNNLKIVIFINLQFLSFVCLVPIH